MTSNPDAFAKSIDSDGLAPYIGVTLNLKPCSLYLYFM